MQGKKETYVAPNCQVHFVEPESILDLSADLGGWEYGGELSKKNFFDEESEEGEGYAHEHRNTGVTK